MLDEYCYSSTSNIIKLQMKDDAITSGTVIASNFASVNKVTVTFDDAAGSSYNSTDDPLIVSYTAGGIVSLTLGDAALLVGVHEAYFDMYYNGVTDPTRWTPLVRIRKTA